MPCPHGEQAKGWIITYDSQARVTVVIKQRKNTCTSCVHSKGISVKLFNDKGVELFRGSIIVGRGDGMFDILHHFKKSHRSTRLQYRDAGQWRDL